MFEHLLDDAYAVHQPTQREYQQRKELVQVFNRIARELYGKSVDCPTVEEFGSFSMGLFTSESDLDLSINFRNSANVSSRYQVIATLRRFKKKMYALKDEGLVSDILPILNAKVPVLKVVDVASGIECDLSVENRDGISKSKIIYMISSLDERFQKLCILMKTWAKAHGVNSPKDRTLSSFSIVLLVTLHLQTREPPILPPFSAILKDGEDLEMVKKYVERFENYGRRNTESLGELFFSFLIKLASVAKIWPKGLCASPYHGRWISKTWTRIASISVEDFTDHTQNVARAVGSEEADVIYGRIVLTIRSLSSFMNGHINESDLKESLFGDAGISRNTVQSVMISKPKERRNQQDMNINSFQNRKRVVTSDGWEVQATQNSTTRIRPPTVGYWRPKQNQDLTLPVNNDTAPETPQAVQPVMPVDLQSTKKTQGSDSSKLGGIPEATQSWGGLGIGDWGGLGSGQSWEGPSSYNGFWGGF
ncbi:protein HESO1-like [Cynara cardunculus var. scolymus]|uniref:protein HESO1-like n=1 Tax=Cynara cardunculus var. scolymus TaxID=59895 RepID=UPI000D6283F1|nr:protein HESO1-like [Cynara cardunculus var. scolymus]